MVAVPFEERVPEDEVRARDAAEYGVGICGDGGGGEEGVEKAGDQGDVLLVALEDDLAVVFLQTIWHRYFVTAHWNGFFYFSL